MVDPDDRKKHSLFFLPLNLALIPIIVQTQIFVATGTLLRTGTHFYCSTNIAIYLQTTGGATGGYRRQQGATGGLHKRESSWGLDSRATGEVPGT